MPSLTVAGTQGMESPCVFSRIDADLNGMGQLPSTQLAERIIPDSGYPTSIC